MTRKFLTPTLMHAMQVAMTAQALSLLDLMTEVSLPKHLVTRYVREMQAAGQVFVGDWGHDRRGYPTIEKYKWGKGTNMLCPKKYTGDAERMRQVRANKKGTV